MRGYRLEIEYQPEGRVAIQVVAMQALGTQETESFVDPERGNVVYLCF